MSISSNDIRSALLGSDPNGTVVSQVVSGAVFT